jgi:hypothetical protein
MMTDHAPREMGPAAPVEVAHGDGHLPAAGQDRRRRGLRRWAWAGLLAQLAFLVSWGLASNWQGPRYSTVAHSISDMYAVTAPHAAFLIIVFTACGAATIGFAFGAVRRALRPGGWTATVGSALLALSIVGLGDLLTPFERLACRLADQGCTTSRQIATTGGMLDNTLSTYGVVALILAGIFLSFAMRRAATWRGWAWPTRGAMVVLFGVAVADAIGQHHGLGGLFERLIALIGAVWLGSLAVAVLRRNRKAQVGLARPGQ